MRSNLLAALLTLSLGASQAAAQCATTYAPVVPTPTVAYSPVIYQTTTPYTGWYPGKYLADFTRSVFGRPTTTYTTGYAPTAYTAGYAPAASPYTSGYAPGAGFQTAYRPTYPITYGPVVQSVSRPVVLAPVMPACDACGVSQSVYNAPYSDSCSSCQSSSATYLAPESSSTYTQEPRPALGPQDNPPLDRSLIDTQKPETSNDLEDFKDTFDDDFDREPTSANDASSSSEYWRAPPLYAPSNRVTRNSHPAPVHTAVYRREVRGASTAFDATPAAKPARHLGADSWTSAER